MRILTNLISWLKRTIRDQLGFTYAETNGMLVLLPCICCLLATPSLMKWYDQKYNFPNYETDLSLLNSTLDWLQKQQVKNNAPAGEVFTTHISPQLSHSPSLDINTATQEKLQTIPAIGPVRSASIIQYRNRLGGFVHKDQYAEIYGLDFGALQNLLHYTHIAPNFKPKKLFVNQDAFKTLLQHPYLSYDQVKRIVRCREKNKRFNSIQDLLYKKIIDQDTFEKVKDYLAI